MVSGSLIKYWACGGPTRWVLVGAGLVLVSNLISTVLSPSVAISLWGSEPALDGFGLYNILSHFLLFAILASHLKTTSQLWRLFALDPFGVHPGGIRVISSLGNPIFAAAFLLMVMPVILAMAVKRNGPTDSLIPIVTWVAVLAVLLLAIAFTQARGPWVGLTAALVVFLALISKALGWRVLVRAGTLLAASLVITWGVITFVPTGSGHPDRPIARAPLAARVLSITPGFVGTLTANNLWREGEAANTFGREGEAALTAASSDTGLKARLLIWQGAGRLVQHRPWLDSEERPAPIALHLFGYGPEFFRYLFPLAWPSNLAVGQRDSFLRYADAAHNDLVHRTVELGFFGIASYLVLLGSLFATAVSLVMGKLATLEPVYKIAMAAVLASIGGRVLEQMVSIPHLSDRMLFWSLLAVVVALPRMSSSQSQQNGVAVEEGRKDENLSPGRPGVMGTVLRFSLVLVIASAVAAFTFVKNPHYAFAEFKATAADAMLEEGEIRNAMLQIDDAISLAPDIGRFHVTRSKILAAVRESALGQNGQSRIAQEAYSTNQRAVTANPFDVYSRLHLTGSALTLARLGQDGMLETAIEESHRLTSMVPNHWLPHFLLATAYMEQGQYRLAIRVYEEAIRLNPEFRLAYNQIGQAYVNLGQHKRAISNYDEVIRIGGNASEYSNRGAAFFQLVQITDAIEDFSEAIKRDPKLASAHNNRGAAYHESGQIRRAIDDYSEAIRLDPRFAEAIANRSVAFSVLNMTTEAQQDAQRAVELGFSLESQKRNVEIPKND